MDNLKEFWKIIVDNPFFAFLGIFIIIVFLGFIEAKREKIKAKRINDSALQSANYNIKDSDAIMNTIKKNGDHVKSPLILYLLLVIICFAIIILSCVMLPFLSHIIIPLAVLILGFLVVSRAFVYEEQGKKFKENVVKKIISDVNPSFEYYPLDGIPQSEYLECCFREKIDKYLSTDLVKEGEFYYSNVLTYDQNIGSDNHVSSITFSGSFAKTKIKNVNCKILLGDEKIQLNTDLFGLKGYSKLKCQNEEFNKIYKPYSDNEENAYKVLTPLVMKKMIEIKNKFSLDLDIRLINDRLYIRFLSENGFVPKLLFKKSQMKNIYSTIAVIKMAQDILNEIKECIEKK